MKNLRKFGLKNLLERTYGRETGRGTGRKTGKKTKKSRKTKKKKKTEEMEVRRKSEGKGNLEPKIKKNLRGRL